VHGIARNAKHRLMQQRSVSAYNSCSTHLAQAVRAPVYIAASGCNGCDDVGATADTSVVVVVTAGAVDAACCSKDANSANAGSH
jgi:hypothetical protein